MAVASVSGSYAVAADRCCTAGFAECRGCVHHRTGSDAVDLSAAGAVLRFAAVVLLQAAVPGSEMALLVVLLLAVGLVSVRALPGVASPWVAESVFALEVGTESALEPLAAAQP